MFLDRCKAYLKSEDGELMETGVATISVKNKSVDFQNDFVPLMKLGTTAKIICVIKDPETDAYVESHCFSGEVYLSSPHLLRIINVNDSIISGAEKNFTVEVNYPAKVSTSVASLRPRAFYSWTKAVVYMVSANTLRFTSEATFQKEQKLLLQCPELLGQEEITVQIFEVILFGNKLTAYHCKILNITAACQDQINEFVRKANVLFPDEVEALEQESIPSHPFLQDLPQSPSDDSQNPLQ